MRAHTGCAGAMVGRGVFGNPWIFRDGQALLAGRTPPSPPTAVERFAVALEHARPLDPGAHDRARFFIGARRQVATGDGGDLEMDVDAIEQWAGDA
jgi:tRNA-dihydrouridine synthase